MELNRAAKDSDLRRFREAIFENRWRDAARTGRILLSSNATQSTLIIANQMARSCLRFQPHYDLRWVVRFADEIIEFIRRGSFESELPASPIELENEYITTPAGISSFVTGVEELWKSLSIVSDPYEKVSPLVKAMSAFIIAEVCHYWSEVHPEEWKLQEVFWDAESDSEGRKLLPPDIELKKMYTGIAFLKQPESIGYKVARWMSLADEIEMTL